MINNQQNCPGLIWKSPIGTNQQAWREDGFHRGLHCGWLGADGLASIPKPAESVASGDPPQFPEPMAHPPGSHCLVQLLSCLCVFEIALTIRLQPKQSSFNCIQCFCCSKVEAFPLASQHYYPLSTMVINNSHPHFNNGAWELLMTGSGKMPLGPHYRGTESQSGRGEFPEFAFFSSLFPVILMLIKYANHYNRVLL